MERNKNETVYVHRMDPREKRTWIHRGWKTQQHIHTQNIHQIHIQKNLTDTKYLKLKLKKKWMNKKTQPRNNKKINIVSSHRIFRIILSYNLERVVSVSEEKSSNRRKKNICLFFLEKRNIKKISFQNFCVFSWAVQFLVTVTKKNRSKWQ